MADSTTASDNTPIDAVDGDVSGAVSLPATAPPPLRLSVILPTYNAVDWLPETLAKLREAIARSGFDGVEIIVVDDGSTDGTERVLDVDVGVPRLTVVRQANAGRFGARHAGLRAATTDTILFIDSRVHAHPESLRFLADQLRLHPDRQIWNGHVHTATGSSVFTGFWDAVTFLAWRRYLRSPTLTSYGLDEYDYFPKGTTFFAAPRAWLLEACEQFDSSFEDLRFANDDTLLIRPLAARSRIHLSPEFSCTYFPRDSARRFVAHTVHRGTVFVDGYFRPGTRFYRPLIGLIAASPLAAWLAIRHPQRAVGAVVAGSAALAITARAVGVPARNARSLGALAPLFGLTYGAGVVRGLVLRRSRRGTT